MKGTRINSLDGWRGIAVSLLLIGHFLPRTGMNFGAAGVDFFFVLSGLLMGKLLFIQKTPIPIFYKRRISRIFPVFYLFLAIVICSYIFLIKNINWKETLVSTLFLYNYFPVLGEIDHMPFGHIWSLCVEEHCYIILSLIAIFSRKNNVDPTKIVGIFAFAFASLGIVYPAVFAATDLPRWIMHTEVQGYKIFISVFFMLVFSKIKIPTLPWEIYPCLLSFGLILYWWSIPPQLSLLVSTTLFALAVNLLHAAPALITDFFATTFLRYAGIFSFSIYLWQQPFYAAIGGKLPWWLALGAGIATGILSFYFVEDPIRKYLNSTWGKELHGRPTDTFVTVPDEIQR